MLHILRLVLQLERTGKRGEKEKAVNKLLVAQSSTENTKKVPDAHLSLHSLRYGSPLVLFMVLCAVSRHSAAYVVKRNAAENMTGKSFSLLSLASSQHHHSMLRTSGVFCVDTLTPFIKTGTVWWPKSVSNNV